MPTLKALHYWARNKVKKRKAKFVPVHSKKGHVGSRSIFPLILNIGTRGIGAIKCRLRPLYFRENTAVHVGVAETRSAGF